MKSPYIGILRIAYCVLRIAYCVLRIGYWILPIGYWVLPVAYWVLRIASKWQASPAQMGFVVYALACAWPARVDNEPSLGIWSNFQNLSNLLSLKSSMSRKWIRREGAHRKKVGTYQILVMKTFLLGISQIESRNRHSNLSNHPYRSPISLITAFWLPQRGRERELERLL